MTCGVPAAASTAGVLVKTEGLSSARVQVQAQARASAAASATSAAATVAAGGCVLGNYMKQFGLLAKWDEPVSLDKVLQAAEHGDVSAAAALAAVYWKGQPSRGIRADNAMAVAWAKRAAEGGVAVHRETTRCSWTLRAKRERCN